MCLVAIDAEINASLPNSVSSEEKRHPIAQGSNQKSFWHEMGERRASDVSKQCLRTIIKIHKATKGKGEAWYPEDLQNLLLTASRIASAVHEHVEVLCTGDGSDDSECKLTLSHDLHQIELSCMVISAWANTIRKHPDGMRDSDYGSWSPWERRLSANILPLLVYYMWINCEDELERTALMEEFRLFPRFLDTQNTMDDDHASISSEETLLGAFEEKENSKEYATSSFDLEVRDEETVVAKSYLCGLLRFSTSKAVAKREPEEIKPTLTRTKKWNSVLRPAWIKKTNKAWYERKLLDASELIKRCAIDKTLDSNKGLTNLFVDEAIKTTHLLAYAAGLSGAGDRAFLTFLINRGAPVDGPLSDEASFTPLGQAVRTGTPEACRLLIKAGAKISGQNVSTWDDQEPLAYAVQRRRADIVDVLLKYGAFNNELTKLNEADGAELETSLHRAAAHPAALKVLDVLLQDVRVLKYIDVRTGPKLNTALHCAVQANNLPAVKALLSAGAKIESRNIRLCTPLHVAIKYRHNDLAAYLLTHGGASANAVRIRLEPVLKYAIRSSSDHVVDLLLANGARINDRNSEGKSALHSAASHEGTAVVRKLLDTGADANIRSQYGSTPLFLAAQNGRLATAKLLLERGADPKLGRREYKSSKERDPKHIARSGGNHEIVRLLNCWERGEEYGHVNDDVVDKSANDHECSWEYWFEKYVVRVHEKDFAAKEEASNKELDFEMHLCG